MRESLKGEGIDDVKIISPEPNEKIVFLFSKYREELTARMIMKEIPSIIYGCVHIENEEEKVTEFFGVQGYLGTRIRLKYIVREEKQERD